MAMPWAIVGRFARLASLPGGAEAEREARPVHAAAAGAEAQALVMEERLAAVDGAAEHAAAAAAAEPDFTFRVAPLPRVTVLAAGRGAHPDLESPDEFPYVVSAAPSFLLVHFTGPIFFGTMFWNHLVVVRDFKTADGESTASAERVPGRTGRLPVVCYLESLIVVPSDGGGAGYTIAELQVGRASDLATIIYMRSGPGEAEGWRVRRVTYPLAAAERRWRPHGAVHIDGRIWWFDLTWGILSCRASLEDAAGLVFHELPAGRGFGEGDEPPPHIHTKRWVAASRGKLRYVEIIMPEGGGAAMVCMWSRCRNPEGDGWRWVAEYAVSFEEIWDDGTYRATGLTRSVPVLAVVSPSDLCLVYFALGQRIFGVNVPACRVVRNGPYELANIPGHPRPASGRYVVAWQLPLPQAAAQVIVPRGRTNVVASSSPWWNNPQYQYYERLGSNVPLLPSGNCSTWAQPHRPGAVSFFDRRQSKEDSWLRMQSLQVDSHDVRTIEVWKDTCEAAFSKISEILTSIGSDNYFLALDTEFCIPDDVHPLPYEPPTPDGHYLQLQSYVHGGDLVQVGIGIADMKFILVGGRVFQFNICFDPSKRSSDHPGVKFMRESGLRLEEHARRGLPAMELMAMLGRLGLLMNNKVTWVTYNGYTDLGFMVHLLTNDQLPEDRNEFLWQVRHYFPSSFDCKFLCKYGNCIKKEQVPGKLNEVAAELGAERTGKGHQAASDALLTLRCFRRLKGLAPDFCEKTCGALYGVYGCQDVLL